MRKKVYGNCSICGCYKKLSFEHIPPKAAFNNKRVVSVKFENIISLGPAEKIKGKTQQRGAGAFTLCDKCNNDTGGWYGKDFVNWCYQCYDTIVRSNGKPTLFYLHYMLPLRILKQIVCMFLSLNGPGFSSLSPELRRFVLNKESKYLSPKYRFFTYYNLEGRFRYLGVSVRGIFGTSFETLPMSELSFPPLGYLMTLDGKNPGDKRLCEITHFSRYSYNEFQVMESKMAVLPTHLYFPGDYRTKREIEEDRIRNTRNM